MDGEEPRTLRPQRTYPSDLTDDEWGLVEPLIPPAKCARSDEWAHVCFEYGMPVAGGPEDLPPRSTRFDYLDLWGYDGT